MRKLTFAFLVAAVFVAGCGGSDDKKPSVSATPGTGGATTATTSAAGDDDFAKLVEEASTKRFRVTYETSSSDSAEKDVLTISQDGTGKYAYISDNGDSLVIADGTTYTSCDNVKTTPECTQYTGATGQALVAPFTGFLTVATAAIKAHQSNGFGDTSTETIAGREAKCVSFDYLNAQWKACADNETGILLKWEAGSEGESGSFVATDAGEPKDSDFEPPATPETVPNVTLPGGGTYPGINSGTTGG